MTSPWLDSLFDGIELDISDKKRAIDLIKKALSSLSPLELEELHALQPSIMVEVTRSSDAVVRGKNREEYPTFVVVGSNNGTALCLGPCPDPDPSRKEQPYYWRDAGQWGTYAKKVEGQLLIDYPEMPHLHNTPLIEISQKEWRKSNDRYL
jgi:hypothetical protein